MNVHNDFAGSHNGVGDLAVVQDFRAAELIK
jgi:hypothetical protein